MLEDEFLNRVREFEGLWPIANDNLLAQDNDWWQNACLTHQDGQWLGHVDGYRKAAQLIAMRVADISHDQDYLVWPFLLCWRHHVELQLKNMIFLLIAISRQPGRMRPTHDIAKLWVRFEDLMSQAGFSEYPEMDHVRHTLSQLHKIDPNAQLARYPFLNSGEPARPANLTHIHFRLFHQAMERVANYLDATDTALRQELEARNDYETEMMEQYGDYY